MSQFIASVHLSAILDTIHASVRVVDYNVAGDDAEREWVFTDSFEVNDSRDQATWLREALLGLAESL